MLDAILETHHLGRNTGTFAVKPSQKLLLWLVAAVVILSLMGLLVTPFLWVV